MQLRDATVGFLLEAAASSYKILEDKHTALCESVEISQQVAQESIESRDKTIECLRAEAVVLLKDNATKQDTIESLQRERSSLLHNMNEARLVIQDYQHNEGVVQLVVSSAQFNRYEVPHQGGGTYTVQMKVSCGEVMIGRFDGDITPSRLTHIRDSLAKELAHHIAANVQFTNLPPCYPPRF